MVAQVTKPAVLDVRAVATPVSKPAVEFIDFGCGAGASLPYARKLAGGDGFGVDISEQAVSECWTAGLPAEIGDLLSYSGKNTAAVTTAINLLPRAVQRCGIWRRLMRLARPPMAAR